MDNRGRGTECRDGEDGGDGGVRRGWDGRSDGDRRRGRGGGGNRENEQGGASSPQAGTQEESQPSDSLHQSDHPARPSFPLSPPMPPVPVPMALSPLPVPPPSSWFGHNYLVPIVYAILHYLRSVFRAPREAQQQGQCALQRRKRNLVCSFLETGQSNSSRTAKEKPVRYLLQLKRKVPPSSIPKWKRTTHTVGQQGSLSRLAQNQGLPQQAQETASQESLSAVRVLVQGMVIGLHALTLAQLRTEPGNPNRDPLPEEGRKTTITAENTSSSHIQRTQSADNITSSTQEASRKGPVNMQDTAEQMGNQIGAQQGTTGECTEDNSDDVDSGDDTPSAE